MLAWDHNAYYHRLLLRQLPPRPARVLDVGCGTGVFAGKVAACTEHVDALDRSPQMIDAARESTPANVHCVLADVMTHPLVPSAYDAIVSISTLHHLPLQLALARLADALRPGGVFAAIALPRVDLPREAPVEVAATVYHHLVGLALAAARRSGSGSPLDSSHADMPMLDPTLTTRQVRQQVAAVLPGATVRRLLLWRYLLVWTKPTLAPDRVARRIEAAANRRGIMASRSRTAVPDEEPPAGSETQGPLPR
jgi:SAM-dependent methyltransferase